MDRQTLDSEDIGIIKSEFVAETQFLSKRLALIIAFYNFFMTVWFVYLMRKCVSVRTGDKEKKRNDAKYSPTVEGTRASTTQARKTLIER